MTSDEPLLIRSICEVPDDDTRRLAFADAIEEMAGEVECGRCRGNGYMMRPIDPVDFRKHGENCPACRGAGRVSDGRAERAEFIRVGVELARPACAWQAEGAPSCDSWNDRFGSKHRCNACVCHDALRRCERELLPLCPLWFEVGADKTEWTRGFVSGITWNTEQFMRHAAAIFAVQPVTEVRLTDREPIGGENGRFYYWYREGHDSYPQLRPAAQLPGALFDHLQVPPMDAAIYEGDLVGWRTVERCHAEASVAAVAYGRTLAHLPPLVTPTARTARVG